MKLQFSGEAAFLTHQRVHVQEPSHTLVLVLAQFRAVWVEFVYLSSEPMCLYINGFSGM